MDSTAWWISAALPAAIAAVACWWAHRLEAAGEPPRQRWAAAVLSLGWAIAVCAALFAQRITAGDESSWWWPADFWQRGYLGLLASALILGGSACGLADCGGSGGHASSTTDASSTAHASGGRWVLAGLLAMATALISLPAGEGWEDTQPLHRPWMFLLSAACLLAFWSLDRLGRRGTQRWLPLVVLAMLGGPLLVATTTYGALVQWTIAALAATVVCALFAASGRLRGGIGIAYPATAFMTVLLAAGRFYSYEDLPWWSYAGMLGLAPLVALADWAVASRSPATRIGVAAGVAAAVLAGSAALHLGEW